MSQSKLPVRQGLYDPRYEHDACGVGFIVHIKGHKSHAIVDQGLELLRNLTHRGAVGADPFAGDGAGILIQIPDVFLLNKEFIGYQKRFHYQKISETGKKS